MRPIQVPACWEAQGVGAPGMGESWDQKGDHNAKPIRHKHMGSGWYRKTVKIPADWKGKRVWLKIGGVKSMGWFWVNDRQVALVNNYCGTYKYDVTDLVTPGEDAKVVVQACNTVPSRKGLFSAMHRWGGIYRDMEFEATPQTFIDDAWVRGLFDEKAAEVHVAVAYPATAEKQQADNNKIRLTIEGNVVERPITLNPQSSILNLQSSIFNIQSPYRPSVPGRRNIPTSTRRGWTWWRTAKSSTRGLNASAYALSLNGKKVIDIPEVVWKDHEWKGGGCTLRYKRDVSTDELGLFTLTVPSSLLAPGKPATLGVTAEDKNSRRWFAVMEP